MCPPPAFLTASSIWILLFSPFLQMLWYYLKVTTDTILDSVSTAVFRISHVRYQSEANEFFFPAIPRHVTKYRIPGVFIDNQSWRVYFWTPDRYCIIFVKCSSLLQLAIVFVYTQFISICQVINSFHGNSPSVRVYQVIVTVCFLLYVFVRNLKTLAAFSLIANIFTFTGLLVCLNQNNKLRSL